ncbi:IclR family transcriptional regulator [Brenneria sp. g21c3]|uniref:IclR family transcriptional regulator n=1 Tax=Brenneria sp. g21c3 TaxID=3093893 RepID=UPI002EAB8E9C|nr:IclR family transcriptional regulator [Brenneria sp. g21c3]
MKTRNVQQKSTEEGLAHAESVKGELKTLTKGLAVLDLLIHRQQVRTGDVAESLAIDKSSASRFLQTLAMAGYAQAGERRSFILGPKLAGKPTILRPQKSLRICARPVLERLSALTGEAVHLSILADENVLYLDAIESQYPLRVDSRPGTLAPLAYTAIGRIFLALADAPLPEQLHAQTVRTITDPQRFQAELQNIVQRGYALHDEEYHLGIRGAAAPLRNQNGLVVGAVGVSGPSVRIHSEDLDALGKLVAGEAAKFVME